MCVCNSFSVGPKGANNQTIVEAWLFYNRVDKMWLPVIVEAIPVNQEVACKFFFIAFLFFVAFKVFVKFCSLIHPTPSSYCHFAALFF